VVVVKLIQDALRLVLGAEVGVAEAESAESILEKETEYNDLIRLLKAVQADKQEAATQKDAQAQLEASQARGQKAETLVEEIQRKFDSEQQKKRLQERKQNLEKELEGINSRLSGK
jgi:predicted GIY-YIG superfamily endonuclease